MLDEFHYGAQPTSEQTSREWDFIIVGSGASGSVAAAELVNAGHSVLVLEQGPHVRPSTSYDALVRRSEPAWARLPNGAWALQGYPWSTCNVGGGTVFYAGVAFRYREADFEIEDKIRDADLPLNWPFKYEAIAPYYDEIERSLGVAGAPALDPCRPPGQDEAPLPAAETTLEGGVLSQAARAMGLSPFPTPLALNTIAYGGRPACDMSSPCIEHMCPSGAKGDCYQVFLRPLEGRDNFALLAGMKVTRLVSGASGRIDGVECGHVKTKDAFTFRGRYVLLAANALQTAGLLLRSSKAGIGNEHDMVGRGLCFKVSTYATGYRSTADGALGRGKSVYGPFSTFALTDYYYDDECPTGVGGVIYEARPGFSFSMGESEMVLRVEALLADQPSRRNRLLLSNDRDEWGLPRLVIDYHTHPRDLIRLEHMTGRAEALLKQAGARWVSSDGSGWELGSSHMHGTCRAGSDPKTSVVDPTSRVHSVENLYIIDGSTMPYPASMNPTLTIQAQALRVARELSRHA